MHLIIGKDMAEVMEKSKIKSLSTFRFHKALRKLTKSDFQTTCILQESSILSATKQP